MIEQLLTEGARRSLQQAARLAETEGARQTGPIHLLAALSADQSRASEILTAHGLSTAGLYETLGCGLPTLQDREAGQTEPTEPLPPLSQSLQNVVEAARQHVALLGRHAQVGTEHLLLGLASVESPAFTILQEHGLDRQMLCERIDASSGFSHGPLAVDVRIEPSGESETDRADVSRVLDAAANRAREGLRVVEDFVRFVLDDAHLSRLLKECRHELAGRLSELGVPHLLAARDTEMDVGTEIGTASEYARRCPVEVAEANFKRVEEAVRTLEEFGKIVSPVLGESLGQLRYRLYTLEKAVLLTRRSRSRLEGRCLYLLATDSLCRRGLGPAVREAMAGGVDIVQLREKSLSDRALIEVGRRVREWTRQAGALYIMNDRPDLAVVTEADGVHLGQQELTVREARRIVGTHRLVGVSTHTIEQARQAVVDGADYIGVGPVFPSSTKQFAEYPGLDLVRQVAGEITLPWFAIGGIGPENVAEVVAAGARRVAVSSAVCGADDPAEAARQLRRALGSAP